MLGCGEHGETVVLDRRMMKEDRGEADYLPSWLITNRSSTPSARFQLLARREGRGGG